MTIKHRYIYVIFAVAFIFYQAVNYLYFPLHTVFPDEERFVQRAIDFSQTGVFGNGGLPTAWEMPFTSIFYAIFYYFLGSEQVFLVVMRFIQSLLLLLQGYLLYKISIKIFNDKLSAFLTSFVLLFYPYFIYYQGLMLSETLFDTFLIATFYFIYSWHENGFKIDKDFVLSNLFLVLSIYVKGTLSLLAPLLLAGFYFFNKFKITNTLKILLYSFVLYGLFLSPWWIRNYTVFDTFVPFTTTSSYNLYLGNNPKNQDGGCDWSKDVDKEVVQKIAEIKSELARNKAYKKEAIDFIKANPKRFFELAILKLKRFYSIVPNADGFNSGYYKWISIFSYGVVFVLFLISIVYYMKIFQKLSAIYILFLYFTLLHMVVIASLRYRLPLEPFMILLATAFVSNLIQKYTKIKIS